MPAIGQGNLAFHRTYRAMVTVGEMMTDRGYLIASDVIPTSFDDFMEKYVSRADGGIGGGGAGGTSLGQAVIRRDRMVLACQRHTDEDGEGGVHSLTAAMGGGGGALDPLRGDALGFSAGNMSSVTAAGGGSSIECAMVIFLAVEKFTVGNLHEQVKSAQNSDFPCKTLIFVLTVRPNLIVRRAAEAVNRSNGIKVELFEEDDLAVNITHHELVPKHTPLRAKEVKEVLQAYAIQKHQLPRLLTSDPVAQYFGLEKGQVVCIERKSASAGIYVTYRQVV